MKPKTKKEKWTMPEWVEPYRGMITNTGGNDIDGIMNDKHTTIQTNLPRMAIIFMVTAQIALLQELKKSGKLTEESK